MPKERVLPIQAHIVNDQLPPRVRWGKEMDKYHLLRLAEDGQPLDLPGKSEFLGRSEILEMSRVLVFGERSGMGRDLLEWFREELEEEESSPWFFLQGDRWLPTLTVSSSSNPFEKELLSPDSFLFQLGKKNPSDGAAAIVDWCEAREGQPKLTLLIRDLARLPESEGADAAQALRIAYEHPTTQNRLRIFLVSTSEYEFEDTYIASGLAPMSDRFRLPWLTEEEIQSLARHEYYGISFKQESLDSLMDITGGQPLLVQTLLGKLKDSKKVTPSEVRRAFRSLRKVPPEIVATWQSDLRNRIEKDRELSEALKNYVSGYSRSKEQGIPASHVHLFYPGWIRFDPLTERWKIASKLHAEFARNALAGGSL